MVPHVFVGHVDGSSTLVAIVESDETVVAYTCGVGDKLATHTGWYFGVKAGAVGENVQVVNANSGLRLRGSLTTEGGSGVLTLADKTELPFSVEPARGDAGLFDFEDAANLVGFIRANDGRTAGNAISRVDGTGISTSSPTTTTVSSPVSTTTTPPPSTSTTTTTPTTTTTTTVTFPTGGLTSTVTTTLVTSADKRVIKRTGPVVIFLMHGMADNLGMAPATAKDDFAECAGPKDTPFYGRCEWGQDFLPGLFGSSNVRAQLTTLDGRDVTGDRFIRDVANEGDPRVDFTFDENLGKRLAGDCVADPTAPERFDPRTARHFIVPGALKSSQRLGLTTTPTPPPVAAFVTWRDPTRGMVFSGRRVTRQVYAALRWYEATYKITPGVILLAQSFGGLASRFMLSRPDPATLTGELNREGTPLCKEDLAKMDYVRDRTLYLLTLATPHEGSYLAEWGPPVKDTLRALLAELRQGLATSPLARVLRAMSTISTVVQSPFSPTLLDATTSGIAGFLPQLDSAAALIDMQLKRMEAYNRGPISPERARRTGASPIVGAAKTLIPVYATLARSPGSDAFDGPDVIKGFGKLSKKRAKARGWVMQTMFVSDVMTRQAIPKGFGDATVAPYAEFRSILDRRARLFDSSPTTEQLEAKFGRDIQAVLRAVSPWFLGKFGRNADAVLSALQGEVSVALPHVMFPIHTDQKWKIGFDGTTAEVPIPAFECRGTRILVDLDALARLLVDTYRNTPAVMGAITGLDLRAMLEALGVLIQSTDTFARGVADWFVGKVRELGTLPAECDARPDNPFDVFSLAELANWKIVGATGRIPVPAWIGTGEPVSDGEMDTDGAVHSASALGFTLARTPFYFEHDRRDDGGGSAFGSWYRLYDNPVAERRNHGLQYENDVGLWIRSTFFVPQVGPVPAPDSFSVWVE